MQLCFLCNCLIILFLWFEKSSFTLIFERWMYIYFPMNEIQKYLHVSYYTHFIKTIDSHSQNRLTIETLIQKFYAFSNSPSKSKKKKEKRIASNHHWNVEWKENVKQLLFISFFSTNHSYQTSGIHHVSHGHDTIWSLPAYNQTRLYGWENGGADRIVQKNGRERKHNCKHIRIPCSVTMAYCQSWESFVAIV